MIVVGGEALVDLVPGPASEPGQPAALRPLLPRLGGGPYTTAVALGRLGAPVAFLGKISTDAFGDALIDRLRGAGVSLDLLQRGDELTTLAVITLTEGGSARYTFHVQGTADRMVTDPGPLPAEVTAVSVGTNGMVLEPGATAYETILHREAAAGRLTVLDPNIRTSLIPDPAAYRARFASWLPSVGLLKASVEDVCWLAEVPEGSDVTPVAKEWLRAGVGAVVLTRGGDELSALTETVGRVDVPAVRAVVADTIGAGDTVHAALLAWLTAHGVHSSAALRELDADAWREALGYAAKAAAITVSRVGAEPPFAAELVSN
ncbi:MAG TPA: carbohydrate kinase [Pseudonocardiaceae bacterium]|nr:carbohydrate kinase [Pseudonocardiaceae bacterium]